MNNFYLTNTLQGSESNNTQTDSNPINPSGTLFTFESQKDGDINNVENLVERFWSEMGTNKAKYSTKLEELKKNKEEMKRLEHQLNGDFANLKIKLTTKKDLLKKVPELKPIPNHFTDYSKHTNRTISFCESVLRKMLESETNLKRKIVKVFNHYDDRVNALKKEKEELRESVQKNQESYNITHEMDSHLEGNKEIIKLKAIIKMKEQCIKKLKSIKVIKGIQHRYTMLTQQNQISELRNIITHLDELIQKRESCLRDVDVLVKNSQSADSVIAAIKETIEPVVQTFKNTKIENEDLDFQPTKTFAKSIRDFRELVGEKVTSIRKKEKKIKEIEVKLQEENDNIIGNELSLKTYGNVDDLHNDKKINNYKTKIQQHKKVYEELEKQKQAIEDEIKTMKKDINEVYKSNKNKMRSLDFAIRQYLFDSQINNSKINVTINQLNDKFDISYTNFSKIRSHLTRYKELQRIKHFLYKRGLITWDFKDNPMSTRFIQVEKKKTKSNPDCNNKAIIDIKKTIERQMSGFNTIAKERVDSVRQVNIMFDELQNLNSTLKNDIEYVCIDDLFGF